MTSHLADQFRRAFEGGAWHGTSVFELLEDVDLARAMRSAPGSHTIWELTSHITVWLEVAHRRVRGETAKLESESENFPPVGDPSAAAWSAARERLRAAFRQLHDTIESLSDADLARPMPGQEHDLRFLLDGVIQHSLYHAGQIALLRKLPPDDDRAMLRHALATLAYRAEKSLRDAPSEFAQHRIGPSARTPLEIVGHLGDLLDWAEALANGQWKWNAASVGEWDAEVSRFFAALARTDARLASAAPLGHPASLIFQGPIADAFTHVGQLAMLRGLAGAPVRPESFARAEIAAGRVGRDQSANRREFDGDASKKK